MVSVAVTAEAAVILVIFIAIMLLITDDSGSKEQKLMSFFLCGILVQNAGYLMEFLAPTMETALVYVKIQYLGSVFVPLCYCWFLYSYCYENPPKKLMCFLVAMDIVTLGLVFSLEAHSFYYREIDWIVNETGHYCLNLKYGPGFLLFIVCGCVIPYALSIYILVKSIAVKSKYVIVKKYKTILILTNLPMFALLLHIAKLTHGFDPTPFVFGIVLSLVVILIWIKKTYDFRRLAADMMVESIGDGVIALNTRKEILYYNQAAEDIFLEFGNNKLGGNIASIKAFPAGELDCSDNIEFCLNGHYYESHTQMLQDKNGRNQGYVLLVIDVTDTKNYIEEIKRLQEKAEHANEAKSEFLANMSHEIRTPMNVIVGMSDIIMEESQGRKLYSYAGDIKSASQNLLAIINDILDLSKIEAGKMELATSDYHVKTVVNEVVHMMDIAASQRGILMKYEYDETIPCRYHGDEGRIKQILINLLNNAVKFTKEGYVKVSVHGRPGESEDEEILIFAVEDTGCGIRKEDQEKIFENFTQVDSSKNRNAEGTGLGLSITKRLVQMMGGRIELESAYGEGATFTVSIPQKIVDRRTIAEVPAESAFGSEQVEAFTAEGYRVLVVDDNRINRKLAAKFLDKYKFELAEAASGFEAVELVRKTRYDMIFMDHMMPEMDGMEAVRMIRTECGENGTSPVIIALTANAMERVRSKFLKNGFQDFLSKPMDRKHLNDILLKWVPAERRKTQGMEERETSGADSPSDFDGLHIQGIDNDAVRKYQTGSLSDYIEILQLYCADGKRKTALLKRLYEEKDYQRYEIEVHGLKSASANVGATALSAAARAHEEAAGRGDTEFIAGHFTELIASYEEQLKRIGAFLDERQGAAMEAREELPAIDGGQLAREVGEALELLENFHSKECAAGIDKLLRHRLDAATEAELAKIREQLRLYEDTEAEELLRGLSERIKREEAYQNGKESADIDRGRQRRESGDGGTEAERSV